MKQKVQTQELVQLVTVIFLVVFQGLFVFTSALGAHWEVAVVCLAMDALLLIALFRVSAQTRSIRQALFQRINVAFHWVLDLTRTQQNSWRSKVRELQRVEPEDLAAVEGIQRLVATDDTAKGRPVDFGQELTIESMIDSAQTIVLLNQSLATDLDEVFGFYSLTYARLRKLQTEYRLNHFRLKETVGFLSEMGSRTNQYSEKLVLDVLSSFQEVTRFSEGISNDVMSRIHSLMDSANPESLDAIRRGSAQINRTMDGFFSELGQANSYSEKVIAENLAQMARVQTMAVSIADFSESIRMISLNLNIEAARSGSQGGTKAAGRSFQVLATKLSEFTVLAKELAQQQHSVIENASRVMEKAGRAQMDQLGALMTEIPKIKAQLDPFETVVRQSFTQFESVVGTMERLSSSINEKLKAVIGKFQFQDLVRQEQEHTLLMLKHLWHQAEQISDRGTNLDEKVKTEALGELLKAFEAIASTENERAVLRSHRNKVSSSPQEADQATAGSVSLF